MTERIRLRVREFRSQVPGECDRMSVATTAPSRQQVFYSRSEVEGRGTGPLVDHGRSRLESPDEVWQLGFSGLKTTCTPVSLMRSPTDSRLLIPQHLRRWAASGVLASRLHKHVPGHVVKKQRWAVRFIRPIAEPRRFQFGIAACEDPLPRPRVAPWHPLRRFARQLRGMPLQLGHVVERIVAAQLRPVRAIANPG